MNPLRTTPHAFAQPLGRLAKLLPLHRTASLCLAAVCTLSIAHEASADDGTWGLTTGGTWQTDTNWVDGIIADGADNTASFGTGSGQVNLSAPLTIGNLYFNGTSTWILHFGSSFANNITLSTTSGTPTITTDGNARLNLNILGTQGFEKLGSETLIISSVSNYSGQTIVSEGNISIRINDGSNSNGALGKYGVGNETVIQGTGNTSATRGSVVFDDTGFYTVGESFILSLDNTSTSTFTDLIYKQSSSTGTTSLTSAVTFQRRGSSSSTVNYGITVDAGTLNLSGGVTGDLASGATEAASGQSNKLVFTVSSSANVNLSGAVTDGSIGQGGLGLSLVGTGGRMVLSGNANTYSGGTIVTQGTLVVSNTSGSATGTGAVLVQAGGTLAGTGIIAPTGTNGITFENGAELTPGDGGIGTLTVDLSSTSGTMSFESGATLAFDLTSSSWDQVQVSGLSNDVAQVLFNGNSIVLSGIESLDPGTYTLFTFDADNAYSGSLSLAESYAGVSLIYNADSIALSVVIPEAGTYALALGVAGLALSIAYRRRQRS